MQMLLDLNMFPAAAYTVFVAVGSGEEGGGGEKRVVEEESRRGGRKEK